jgi:hypothetical protein
MLDSCLDRIAELETENERLKSFEIYEVFTADDGEPGTRPVDWPAKVAELKAELERKDAEILEAEDQRMQLKADIDTLKGLLAQAEAALAERDECVTIAYRLLLQGYSDEASEYLLPFSTDFKARAEKGSE